MYQGLSKEFFKDVVHANCPNITKLDLRFSRFQNETSFFNSDHECLTYICDEVFPKLRVLRYDTTFTCISYLYNYYGRRNKVLRPVNNVELLEVILNFDCWWDNNTALVNTLLEMAIALCLVSTVWSTCENVANVLLDFQSLL